MTHIELTVDEVLTTYAVNYMQSDEGKRRILRLPGVVPVSKRAGKYPKWDKGSLLRSEMKPRARGTPAAIGGQGVSLEDYSCERYAVATKLCDEDYDDYRRAGMSEAQATQAAERSKAKWLVEQAYLKMAKAFGDTLLVPGSWGTGVGGIANQTGIAVGPVGANQFIRFNATGGVPISTFLDQHILLETSIGQQGNALLCGTRVHRAIRTNDEVKEQLKHTDSQVPREGRLADLFEVDTYVKLSATENTAAQGQTPVMAQIFGNHALLGFFSNEMDMPGAAKVFSFDKYGGWPEGTPVIFSYYEPKTRTWYFEAELYYDIKVTAADAAVFSNGAVG